MEKDESKKVIAYIDAANIILSCNRAGIILDFLKLQVYLKHKFRVDDIHYFTANLKKISEDIDILRENNFKIVLKDLYIENSKTKANCDVEIAHYITKHIENKNVKELVLLSGDGDFSMLLDYAYEKSVKVSLMPADKKSSSKILRIKTFIKIIFLEELKDLITKEKTPANTQYRKGSFSVNKV